MTRDQVADGAELVFSDSDPLPIEEVCEECGDEMEEGICLTCNPDISDYEIALRAMSPLERKQERAYWEARNRGFED